MSSLKKYEGIAVGDKVSFVPTNEDVVVASIRKHASGGITFSFPTPPEFNKQYKEKNGFDYFMIYVANRSELALIY